MPRPTVAFVIDQEHVALLRQVAKDQGDSSTSAALRRIIDEWRTFKMRQLQLAPDAACDEERAATLQPELAGIAGAAYVSTSTGTST